jgi:hypothetical protein
MADIGEPEGRRMSGCNNSVCQARTQSKKSNVNLYPEWRQPLLKEIHMDYHRICTLFPRDDEAVKEISRDISANGLREPITTYDGQILDGRHRWEACLAIGVKPDPE